MQVIRDRDPYSVHHPILQPRVNRVTKSKLVKTSKAQVATSPASPQMAIMEQDPVRVID